ncbi:MAG: BON domain-containing protein [Candidatus Tectimicrobiota bacterium]
MKKAILLATGLGLGAGVMYLAAPASRPRRRRFPVPRLASRSRFAALLDQNRRALYRQGQSRGRQIRQASAPARAWLEHLPVSFSAARGPVARWSGQAAPGPCAQALLMLGYSGFGAALMYLLQSGAGQEGSLAHTLQSYWRKTTEALSQRSVSGPAAASPSHAMANQILEARVRAQMVHSITLPETLQVTAEQGRVTLAGQASARTIDRLLAVVASVTGVQEVVNQLRPEATPQSR